MNGGFGHTDVSVGWSGPRSCHVSGGNRVPNARPRVSPSRHRGASGTDGSSRPPASGSKSNRFSGAFPPSMNCHESHSRLSACSPPYGGCLSSDRWT